MRCCTSIILYSDLLRILRRIYISWNQSESAEHTSIRTPERNSFLTKNCYSVSIYIGIVIRNSDQSHDRVTWDLNRIYSIDCRARLEFKFRFVVKLSISSRTRGTIVNAMLSVIYQRICGGFTTPDRTGNGSQSAEPVNPLYIVSRRFRGSASTR